MSDSEEFPDDVPVADAADQRRAVHESGLDSEDVAPTAPERPLEASAADWQEQLETVETDPDEFFSSD